MKYFYADKLDKLRHRRTETLRSIINQKINSKDHTETSYVDYTHEMVTKGELTQDEEIADMFVLFAAGMDTTSSTLEFSVTLLAKYQGIQDKVRKELLDVMGKQYNIKLINKCSLFRAAVHEIMRISSVVFGGLHHLSYSDYWVELDDGTRYKIPKNYLVTPNLDYIHIYGKGKDEHWKRTNGDEIILDNFLIKDDDGGIRFVTNESFIPFGVGKRNCIGRELAMKEIYYTLGYLLMNYKVSLWNKEDENRDVSLMRSSTIATAFLDPSIPIKIEKV